MRQSMSPDKLTLLVFLLIVFQGGSNAVAVRFSNLELAPFWGAAFRFSSAALIFWAVVFARGIPVPKGKAFLGAAIYGALGFGVFYACLYWALLSVTASLTMVVLAMVPLLTFFSAWAHGLEVFRWRGLAGAFLALAGIVIAVGDQIGSSLQVIPLLAIFIAGVSVSEATVIYKSYPKGNPFTVNAVSLSAGAILLLLFSLVTGEEWNLPASATTWLAFLYLVLAGSVVLFYFYLFVLERWTASATSYAFLLFPIATIIIAALVLDEVITPRFLLGGAIVLIGVWVGALSGSKKN